MRVAHTFVATVEDRPGALNRVVSLFRRRGFNIASLTVGTTERPGVSRITLVVNSDPDTARRVKANLEKLVDILQVQDLTGVAALTREYALVKASVPPEKRPRWTPCSRCSGRTESRRWSARVRSPWDAGRR